MKLMQIFMKYILFLFFCLLLPEAGASSHPYYHCKQVSIEHGVPASVTALCRDDDHSLWIGTELGVYRMKGEKLEKYELPYLLRQQTHYIVRMGRGPGGSVWVANAQGLCYYDPHADSLRLLSYRGQPLGSEVVLSDERQLAVPWRDSLLVYDGQMRFSHAFPLRIGGNRVLHAVPFDAERWLLVGSGGQLPLLRLKDGKLSPSPFPELPKAYCAFRDRQGRFWISCYGKGVYCYSAQGELLQAYNTRNSQLAHDVVLDITEWNDAIWMATDGGGVNVVYPDTRKVQVLSGGQNRSFPGNSVTALCPAGDHIWAGTVREGVLCIEKSFITTYTRRLENMQAGLSDKCPLCLWEDADGMLWIGTDGGGINRLDPRTERFTHYPSTAGEKIVSICAYPGGKLLLSAYAKGLFLFDKQTGACRPFALPDSVVQHRVYLSSAPLNLHLISPDEIGIYGNGSYHYHLKTHRLVPVQTGLPDLQNSWIYMGEHRSRSIFNDRRHVFQYDRERQRYDFLSYNPGGQLLSAAIDSAGHLWTATPNGVTRMSLASRRSERVELPGRKNIVTSMVVDGEGTVWMGTSEGVYACDPREGSFTLYNEMDGVLPNNFLSKPVLVSADGDVYMGGTEGLSRFNRAMQPSEVRHPLVLLLQEALLDGRRMAVEPGGGEITLPYDFPSLQVRALIEGGNMLRKRIYRFRVKGLSQGYVETSKPYYTLFSLAPGHYTLTAQCTRKGGGWSGEFPLLHITVLPPWWLQGWFLMLCALLLILSMIYVAYRYDRRMRHKYSEQECVIYKEKVKALININHELRTPLTLIYAPLKQLADNKLIPYELRTKLYGVLKHTRQMRSTIDMILNMRRMEVQKNVLRMSSAPFNDWLQGILNDFQDEFALRQIAIETDLDPRIGQMFFDLNQCEIILNNLLGNAYKFSDEQTTVTVSTRLEEEPDMVYVSVRDQGIGLQQEDLEHLFNRFYQGRHGRYGTGIGLSYVKQLVEMQGGVVGARNNPERGATFFFSLPHRREAASIESTSKDYLNAFDTRPAHPAEGGKESQPKGRGGVSAEKFHSILLVEDDRDLCDYLTCNLQASFEHVYKAHDGMEALPLLASHLPQMVLADIKMPRMDGLELCRYMKQKAELNYIPVVLLTSCVDDAVMEDAYKTGVEAYITKPFDMDLLLLQLQNILRNYNAMKRYYAPKGLPLEASAGQGYPDEQFSLQFDRIIRQHIGNTELDVSFLARQMGMSRAALYAKTKNILQGGISEYITQCRLEMAAQLLSETALSVTEVAERAGFKHARNFSTLFKARYGATPTDYRKDRRDSNS